MWQEVTGFSSHYETRVDDIGACFIESMQYITSDFGIHTPTKDMMNPTCPDQVIKSDFYEMLLTAKLNNLGVHRLFFPILFNII